MQTGHAQFREQSIQDLDQQEFSEVDEKAPEDRLFTIGDMSRDFGISLRALRFYEDRKLLHPRRRGTARLYDGRDRLHLQMILKGKQLGFTLTEIHDLLATRSGTMGEVDLELGLQPEQIIAQIRHLERQRNELEIALGELREVHQRALQAAQG